MSLELLAVDPNLIATTFASQTLCMNGMFAGLRLRGGYCIFRSVSRVFNGS